MSLPVLKLEQLIVVVGNIQCCNGGLKCVCFRVSNEINEKKTDEYFKNYFVSVEREKIHAHLDTHTRPPIKIISDEFRMKTYF